MADEMKATPRNETLGALSDAAKWLQQNALEKQFGYRNPVTEGLSELAGFPALQRTLERASYGEPLTTIGKANVPLLHEDTADAAMLVAPLVKPALKAAKATGKFAGKGALEMINKGMMGEGPLRNFVPQNQFVIKPTGGNWLNTSSVSNVVDPLKVNRGVNMLPQEIADQQNSIDTARRILGDFGPNERPAHRAAVEQMEQEIHRAKGNNSLNQWIDRNLTNYIKKEMGTPEDSVRKLAEEGIVHIPTEQVGRNRYKANAHRALHGGEQLGKSEAARAWEDAADVAISPMEIKRLHRDYREPWMEKTDPSTNIYEPTNEMHSQSLGFDHIMDVLREDVASGRIRPEQLNKVSMEQAVRRTAEYDQELAAKMNASRAAAREGLPVHKEYPEGYKWIELNKPGSFASESEAMGHSVRGYEPPKGHPDWTEGSGDSGSSGYGHGGWEAIKSGKAKVYSLVNLKGEPHVTIEVKRPQEVSDELRYKHRDKINEGMLDYFIDDPDATHEEALESVLAKMKNDFPSSITQIKGKQNAAPKEDYLPFVQDFVKGGKWSDVGDLSNTGLRNAESWVNPDTMAEYRKHGIEVPKYATEAELDALHTQYEKLAKPEGMKRGGKVAISANPDTMRLELERHMAGGGLIKGLAKAASKAVKGAQEVLPVVEREANLAKFLEESAVKNRVYHGTMDDVRKFSDKKLGQNTDSNASSEGYAQTARVGHWFNTNPMGQSPEKHGAGYTVDMPVYLSIKNPKREMNLDWLAQGLESKKGRAYRKELEKQGYDGLVLPDEEFGGESYVAFRPEQIKSAIGNRGTYDINEADINKANGGAIHMGGGGVIKKGVKELANLLMSDAERSLPLRLPRAVPKSAEEINAHAERVARQMMGEHVTSGKAGDTTNLAGRSMKESQRVKNLEYELVPTKEVPKSEVYKPKIGDVNMALPGDFTLSDVELRSLMGEPIGSRQQGGSRYGLGHMDAETPLFYASNEAPAQMVQNKATDLYNLFEPERVMGQHMAMGPVATNFAQHFADANLRYTDYSKLRPADMRTFDKIVSGGFVVKKKNPKTGEVIDKVVDFPDWPGIADPQAAYDAMQKNPEMRKFYNRVMQTPKITQPLGFPNGQDIRYAITSPDLRDMEVNLTGHGVGELVPGARLTDTAQHNTYSKGIPGMYVGHQEVLTPFSISFPDAAEHIMSTQRPQDFTGTIQKVFPHQRVDQQFIDEMEAYSRRIKELTGKKKGGAVKKADGGAVNYNTSPDMSDGGRLIQGNPFKRGGKVKMTSNRDTMLLELSKLKRK